MLDAASLFWYPLLWWVKRQVSRLAGAEMKGLAHAPPRMAISSRVAAAGCRARKQITYG